MRVRGAIFTTGPWRAEDGDPAFPRRVFGVPVAEFVSRRPDGSGALVRLVDGRYALTGKSAAVGPRRKLERHLRRRDCRHDDEEVDELRSMLVGDAALAGPVEPGQ